MILTTLTMALLAPAPAWATAPPAEVPAIRPADDGREELQEILDEYDDAMLAFREAYEAAAQADKGKIYQELYPQADDYAVRLLSVAQRFAKTDVAADALAWVAARTRGDNATKAIDQLVADHFESEKMAEVCMSFPRDDAGKGLLERLVAESPHRTVQGMATYALASRVAPPYDASKPWPEKEEYLGLMRTIAAEYADVAYRDGTLGAIAEGGIFQVERLQIGMEVPDIEGEDIDGVPFQLSDYRGKVVLLDFWGHW